MNLCYTQIRRDDRGLEVVPDSGAEPQGFVIGLARSLELTQPGLTGSVTGVRKRQANRVLAGVEGGDRSLQLRRGRREFEEEEVAVCFGVPQDGRNVLSNLVDSLVGLLTNCGHSCFVARVHTRSSAFEEGVTDEV